MLPVDKLYPVLSQAERDGLFSELQNIYSNFPETQCKDCATCCAIPTPGYLIEYLNMYKYIKENLQDKWPRILENTVKYFYLEMVDVDLKCPFLGEDNHCLVHQVRPLTCRTHGLVEMKDADQKVSEMEKIAKRYKEKYDIILPEEIIRFKLPACPRGSNTKGPGINTQLAQGISNVAKLESELFSEELAETEYTFVPLATHLALTMLSEGARIRRTKVMKEYLETGKSELLEGYIDKARSFKF